MFSVGVLYSCHSFLELVRRSPIDSTAFPEMFQTFEVASATSILQVTQLCEWISLGANGEIHLSSRGAEVLRAPSPDARLRVQLQHMVTAIHPPWLAVLTSGRREAERSLPPDARQCFREAGLLDGYDAAVIEWWDKAAGAARIMRDETKRDSGRIGERYSIAYETSRVGKEPYWQGFESNFAGYDLISQQSRSEDSRLLIEVKASFSRLKEARFFISRNEWDVATTSDSYLFHLWVLKPSPMLLVVPRDDVLRHIPGDQGDGQWKQAILPMTCFHSFEVPVGVIRTPAK
jgi:hypothetical protein